VSGLIFAAAEAVNYSLQYAALRDAGTVTFSGHFILQMPRWISLPLVHGIWTGIASYFIGFSSVATRYKWSFLALAIAIPVLLHAAYDTARRVSAHCSCRLCHWFCSSVIAVRPFERLHGYVHPSSN